MRTLPLAFLLTIVLFTSCKSDIRKNSILFGSGGNTSEILLVTHKTWWDGMIGDTVRATLGETSPWLVQEQPLYDIKRISPINFDGVYQKQRNIIIIASDENLKEPKVEFKRDVWATPQVVVKFMIPNEESFASIYSKYYPQIAKLFNNNELQRLLKSFKIKPSLIPANKLNQRFGVNLLFPKGFYVVMDTTDFMWFRCETADIEQGILIYTYPYKDTNQFNANKVSAIRNEFTRKYVKGPLPESYMQLSPVFPIYSERTEFKGQYATELRSWWEMQNYPMGGPFLSYTFYDQKNQRMMVLDSYINAPKKGRKRDILLQLEAVFDSFSFGDSLNVKP